MLSYFPILHSCLHMNPNMVLAVWDTLCLFRKMRWGQMMTVIYILSLFLCCYLQPNTCWTPSSGSGKTLDPEDTKITQCLSSWEMQTSKSSQESAMRSVSLEERAFKSALGWEATLKRGKSLFILLAGKQKIPGTKLRFLEKAVAPHSSTLAWKIPWVEEPGGL